MQTPNHDSRRRVLILLLICVLAGAQSACRISDLATRMFFRNLPEYFVPNGEHIERFDHIAGDLYSFRLDFDRNVVLKTSAGLVVIDSFNDEFSQRLSTHLAREFPGMKVHTLIYSHYHLDHVRGGQHLHPKHVLTHAQTPRYWKELAPWHHDRFGLKPTRLLRGDQILRVGDRKIQLLYLGKSHTDTLYAFYFPEERALFAPDMGFVRTVVPGGLPDMYFPGYMAALDRLLKLDIQHYVPSHFDPGTAADLENFADFMKESRVMTAAVFREHGRIDNPNTANLYFDGVYLPLKKKYGDWHGFDQMILPHIIRNFTGTYLGY